MKFSIAQDSLIGGREINQDRAAWHATDDAVLLVVADGMGGHLQGEVAAQLAVETIVSCFKRMANPRIDNVSQFLSSAMQIAHNTIVRYAIDCRMPQHSSPRTTCIACVVQDGMACWAHAGDSRLYLIHGQSSVLAPSTQTAANHVVTQAVTQTRDHSVVQRLFDEGQISKEQMAVHPMRHHVFSCLGGDIKPHIEISPSVALADNDVLALCTDGAWSLLHNQLPERLSRAAIETTVPQLLEFAASHGGPHADNLTMLVMRWHSPDLDVATTPSATAANEVSALHTGAVSDAEIDSAINDIKQRLSPTPDRAVP